MICPHKTGEKTDHYSYNELKKDKKDLAKGKWAGNKMLNAVHVNVPWAANKRFEISKF